MINDGFLYLATLMLLAAILVNLPVALYIEIALIASRADIGAMGEAKKKGRENGKA